MTVYRLTDSQYAEALRTAFAVAMRARFEEDSDDPAAEGIAAGIAYAEGVARLSVALDVDDERNTPCP